MNINDATFSSIASLPQASCYIPRASLSSRSGSIATNSSDSVKSYNYHHHQQRRQSELAKIHKDDSSIKWKKLEEGAYSMPSISSISSISFETTKRQLLQNKNHQFSKNSVKQNDVSDESRSISENSSTNSLHVSHTLNLLRGAKTFLFE